MDNFAFDPFLRVLAKVNCKVCAVASNLISVASCLLPLNIK